LGEASRPNGKTPTIVELLSQTNEILDDMLWKEGNLPTGNRTTQRTALPTVSWRLINQGVASSKSTTIQIDDQTGMLEAWSEVDCKLAQLNGNVKAFRLSEAEAFIEAMNQEMARRPFSTATTPRMRPNEFNGLTTATTRKPPRPHRSAPTSSQGRAPVPTTASIYLIVWGKNSLTGIFPKGSKAGLSHEDLGEQTSGIRPARRRWNAPARLPGALDVGSRSGREGLALRRRASATSTSPT
jgi:hypothetical protein